jgi:YVTN family beta-propeller protein
MKRSLVLALFCAACGDNFSGHDHSHPDAGGPADMHVPAPRAVAVAGDFMSPGTGVVSKLDITALDMRTNLVPSAALGDPVLRQIGDKLYIVNRFGSNNVTILDAKTFQVEEQISTGANSNPQDVAVVGDKLYVPATGTAGVVVIKRGSQTTTTIDLSALDTQGMNDGKPDCVTAYAVGTKVYVACGVLDNFNAAEVGKIAVIDSATDTMTAHVDMNYKNPYGFFVRAPEGSTYTGDLLIPSVPSFSSYTTGCLERVTTTGDTPTVGCGLTNAQLAGFANKLAVSADGAILYIAVGTYDQNFSNPTGTLEGFDLASGMLWSEPVSPATQMIVDVAACPGGDVVAMDQTFNMAGLRVWRGMTERTTEPKSIGLPPTVNALVCYDP